MIANPWVLSSVNISFFTRSGVFAYFLKHHRPGNQNPFPLKITCKVMMITLITKHSFVLPKYTKWVHIHWISRKRNLRNRDNNEKLTSIRSFGNIINFVRFFFKSLQYRQKVQSCLCTFSIINTLFDRTSHQKFTGQFFDVVSFLERLIIRS